MQSSAGPAKRVDEGVRSHSELAYVIAAKQTASDQVTTCNHKTKSNEKPDAPLLPWDNKANDSEQQEREESWHERINRPR